MVAYVLLLLGNEACLTRQGQLAGHLAAASMHQMEKMQKRGSTCDCTINTIPLVSNLPNCIGLMGSAKVGGALWCLAIALAVASDVVSATERLTQPIGVCRTALICAKIDC
jgi:hypothetical protein